MRLLRFTSKQKKKKKGGLVVNFKRVEFMNYSLRDG